MLASLRPGGCGGSAGRVSSAATPPRPPNPLLLPLRPRPMAPASATRGGGGGRGRVGTTTSGARARPGTTTTTTTTTRGRPGTTTTRGSSTPPPARRAPSPRRQQPPQQQRPKLSDAERNDPERGERGPGRGYFNFTGFPFPLGPYFERRTTRREIVKDTVWTFDQTQAIDFFAVYTPVRMTVVRLASTGGLWVHAPVAPTDECVRLLRELDAPVEHIVLPTFAYEHKVFVGPFSRRFPKAKVWVAPAQWSFPLNLPPQFFGIFPAGELCDFSEARAAGALTGGGEEEDFEEEDEEDEDEGDEGAPSSSSNPLAGSWLAALGAGAQKQQQQQKARGRRRPRGSSTATKNTPTTTLPPWADEIDCKVLKPPQLSLSRDVVFSEAALLHRASRTLMVTDAVVYVPRDPPEVIPKWALLALGARDGFLATYLTGGRTKAQVEAEARRGPPGPDTPEARRLGWARMSLLVLYFQPFDLLTPQESFDAVSERLIVGPVVRTLVYSKIPRAVTRWVDSITSDWKFERVIPCHFAGPVKAGPSEFREAFDFCYEAVEQDDERRRRGRAAEAAEAGSGVGGSGDGAAAEEVEVQADAPLAPAAQASGPGAFFAGLLAAVTGGIGGGKAAAAGKRRPARQLPEKDLGALRSLDALLVRIGAVYPDAEERAARAAAAGKGR